MRIRIKYRLACCKALYDPGYDSGLIAPIPAFWPRLSVAPITSHPANKSILKCLDVALGEMDTISRPLRSRTERTVSMTALFRLSPILKGNFSIAVHPFCSCKLRAECRILHKSDVLSATPPSA